MSVIVILRIPGNPADLESYAAGPGGELLRNITATARAAGALRHGFAAGDHEILVVDEWVDEESFQKFFASQEKIGEVMREAGAQGPPQVSIHRVLNTPDRT